MRLNDLLYELLIYWNFETAFIEALNKSIDTLTPREKEVLIHRYGLNGVEPKTLDATAKLLKPVSKHWKGNSQNRDGITRERVRQLQAKGLRKLRHPHRLKPILKSLGLMPYKTFSQQTVKGETRSFIDRLNEQPIDILNLPTKIYNSLQNGNIKTIGDLRDACESGDIFTFRNMGFTSSQVVARKLEEYYSKGGDV